MCSGAAAEHEAQKWQRFLGNTPTTASRQLHACTRKNSESDLKNKIFIVLSFEQVNLPVKRERAIFS